MPLTFSQATAHSFDKIHPPHKGVRAREILRQQGRKMVFTNGCFDLLHYDHVMFLRMARSFGDVLWVGINTNESIRRLKGAGRPINGLWHRATILLEMESVSGVCLFLEDTAAYLIRELQPDIYVKGGDYTREEILATEEARAVAEYGGRVEIMDKPTTITTTEILRRVREDETGETGRNR